VQAKARTWPAWLLPSCAQCVATNCDAAGAYSCTRVRALNNFSELAELFVTVIGGLSLVAAQQEAIAALPNFPTHTQEMVPNCLTPCLWRSGNAAWWQAALLPGFATISTQHNRPPRLVGVPRGGRLLAEINADHGITL
jgi:hypothetical protein